MRQNEAEGGYTHTERGLDICSKYICIFSFRLSASGMAERFLRVHTVFLSDRTRTGYRSMWTASLFWARKVGSWERSMGR